MRKSNREIKNIDELKAILDGCDVCRLGLCDHGQPYIVPLNFGYSWPDSGLVLYFHCAAEGRKLDILRQNNRVCLELDWRHELKTAGQACQFSMHFESLIGEGEIAILTDDQEKIAGLDRIMAHYHPGGAWTYDQEILAKTCVLRLQVSSLTGKRLDK